MASDFLNWFNVVLIGLLVCVVKGKAKPTAAASERGFGKYGRSIAGDVEIAIAAAVAAAAASAACCCRCYCC